MNLKFKQRMMITVSLLIIFGFVVTAIVSFVLSRQSVLDSVINHELPLTSDNIYAEVQRDLILPRTVASFMGNDSFLQDWVMEGEQDIQAITRYLDSVKTKYGAFTAFFVSEQTRNYYHSDGLLKQVSEYEFRDKWYFRVRELAQESELNLDPDLANDDTLTIFINYRVVDANGNFLGATGLGLKLASMQNILGDYRKRYSNNVYFLTPSGEVLLQDSAANMFSHIKNAPDLAKMESSILNQPEGSFSYVRDGKKYLLNTRFIEELNLILCVEIDEDKVTHDLQASLIFTIIVCLLVTGIVLAILLKVIHHYQKELEDQAWHDPLTGLFNRRAFIAHYQTLAAAHADTDQPLSLLVIDVDHFKAINDRFGHSKGDQVIVAISHAIKSILRPADILSRWGGDEFLILLPESDKAFAESVAECLVETIATMDIACIDDNYNVTVSIGTATERQCFDIDQHIHEADTRMYTAKAGGRNQVSAA